MAHSVPNAIEKVLYQVLVKFEKPDDESRLTPNARKMENSQKGVEGAKKAISKNIAVLESK